MPCTVHSLQLQHPACGSPAQREPDGASWRRGDGGRWQRGRCGRVRGRGGRGRPWAVGEHGRQGGAVVDLAVARCSMLRDEQAGRRRAREEFIANQSPLSVHELVMHWQAAGAPNHWASDAFAPPRRLPHHPGPVIMAARPHLQQAQRAAALGPHHQRITPAAQPVQRRQHGGQRRRRLRARLAQQLQDGRPQVATVAATAAAASTSTASPSPSPSSQGRACHQRGPGRQAAQLGRCVHQGAPRHRPRARERPRCHRRGSCITTASSSPVTAHTPRRLHRAGRQRLQLHGKGVAVGSGRVERLPQPAQAQAQPAGWRGGRWTGRRLRGKARLGRLGCRGVRTGDHRRWGIAGSG